MASLLGSAPRSTAARDEVYVAAVPLRATKGPAQLLMSRAYSIGLSALQHYLVIIKPNLHPQSQAIAFDFQPQDPENMLVALAALAGRRVPGTVLTRKLTKLPKSKCWFAGAANKDAVAAAHKFNSTWESDLRIGHHDCRHYTNGKKICKRQVNHLSVFFFPFCSPSHTLLLSSSHFGRIGPAPYGGKTCFAAPLSTRVAGISIQAIHHCPLIQFVESKILSC